MAEKNGPKPKGDTADSPRGRSLGDVYPTVHRCASGYGWVEFGIDARDRPFVRALDEGGEVWEGTAQYQSLDEALAAMEEGLKEFMRQEGFGP